MRGLHSLSDAASHRHIASTHFTSDKPAIGSTVASLQLL
jgi:hypothetical protein